MGVFASPVREYLFRSRALAAGPLRGTLHHPSPGDKGVMIGHVDILTAQAHNRECGIQV